MNEVLLQVNDLRYSYDGKRDALHIDHFEISRGERLAVLGANGAGKSTFFLCMNGVLHGEGEIRFRGTVIEKKNINELRKNVGIVFQDADKQIIASTVAAEISFGPMNLRLPREEVVRRVNSALDYMNLNAMRDRPPHYLSGGEKKRVTIADIIAMESEIFVFDEPTASLDPLNIEIFEEVLAKLEAAGKTVIVSTHDVEFAYRWASRVIVVNSGTIIADDTPLSVFRDQEILHVSNLKQPQLLQICDALKERKLLPQECDPTTVDMLLQCL